MGTPTQVKIVPERTDFAADNRDLCYFDLYVCDENGDRIPYAQDELTCICGGGELMGIFSGDPANGDAYTSEKCHAFDGRAVAVVRAKNPGDITLTVHGKNLKEDCVTVTAHNDETKL